MWKKLYLQSIWGGETSIYSLLQQGVTSYANITYCTIFPFSAHCGFAALIPKDKRKPKWNSSLRHHKIVGYIGIGTLDYMAFKLLIRFYFWMENPAFVFCFGKHTKPTEMAAWHDVTCFLILPFSTYTSRSLNKVNESFDQFLKWKF